MKLSERYRVIDIDTHVIEPPDLWTSRMSKKWGDMIPHTRVSEKSGIQRWWMGDLRLPAVGSVAHAGWKDAPPAFPPTIEQADPASWEPHARLKRMDEYGIYAALLYGNLLGFQAEAFIKMGDKQLALECVQAYNDFLVDFCSVDTDRLIPLMSLPFWDIDASVKEIERCVAKGHRGITFGGDFSPVGLPAVGNPHWDKIMVAAQHHEMSINFHIGFGAKTLDQSRALQSAVRDDKGMFVKESIMLFMSNADAIGNVILSGLCERFPTLKFVSVESGASWLPFFVESMDWQWKNSGCQKVYPKRMLPSEYFRRQVYGSFWFETEQLRDTLQKFPDNIMFETDYPHPTSLSPGPASFSDRPDVVIENNMVGLPEDVVRKVLHDTAAKLYHLRSPAERSVPMPA